jgi:hypothetical protein
MWRCENFWKVWSKNFGKGVDISSKKNDTLRCQEENAKKGDLSYV